MLVISEKVLNFLYHDRKVAYITKTVELKMTLINSYK